MTNSINRRAMMSGATALPMLALPDIAKALPLQDDADLFDIISEWEAGKKVESVIGAEHSALERQAKANEPPVPAPLLQPFKLGTGSFSPHGARGWTVQEILFYEPTNAEDLLSMKQTYEASYEAVWKDAEEGQVRFDAIVSENTDLINNLAETPAHTLQGLLAKCHVAQSENLFKHFMDFSDFAQSLVEDIERIAPQFIGRA